MPSVPHIIRMRQRRRLHDRSDPSGPAGLGGSLLLSLLAALSLVAITLLYTDLAQGLPSLESLPALLDPPQGLLLQPTRFYDRSGEVEILRLQNPAASGSQYLYVSSQSSTQDRESHTIAPGILISATVAAADPTFFTNRGFTLEGIRQGEQTTLAQHLVHNLLFWDEPAGTRRALRERLLAAQITAQYGRNKVLEWYLNSANYGHLAYSADAASRAYFGKPASRLTLAEAALLAAIADQPERDPLNAPQAAIQAQQQVLQKMLELGFISSEQVVSATQEKLSFLPQREAQSELAPAFANLALQQVESVIPPARLERGGLKVLTTLNFDLQLQASCASITQLERLGAAPVPVQFPAHFDCQAGRLLSPLPANLTSVPGLGANVVVLDPTTGQVLAYVSEASASDPAASGQDFARAKRSYLAAHPAGTLLTPFIYLTSFARGLSPASLVWDIPDSSTPAGIQNFDSKFHGPVRLRIAMTNDYLIPAEKVLAQVGAENVWRTALEMGLSSFQDSSSTSDARQIFDGSSVSLLEASQAFSVVANQGTSIGRAFNAQPSPAFQGLSQAMPLRPVAVQRVEDSLGNEWLDWSQSQSRPVISPQLSYLLTNVLSDEAARWPSLGHPNPLEVGRPAAAKIGRTLSGSDTWTIGYTPQMVVGVWIGKQSSHAINQSEEEGRTPPNAAAGLWHAMIQYASRDHPAQTWSMPSGLSRVEVCDPSGELPTEQCPSVVTELFLDGNQPTHRDTLYRAFQINRETGRLATVFTPPDLVEERVYLVVPPEASAWASQAGLPVPPETYDVIAARPPGDQAVQISSPAMFAYVHGQVSIQGSADGQDLDFYRVQVGEGLNPQAWLQIGQDSAQPVKAGQLAVWDTSGLNGLYAVQLLLVRKDQSVETTVIQVTVDNQAPEVQILYPDPGQEFKTGTLTFQVQASDDLALQNVEFSLDGRRLVVLAQPPFAFPWKATTGKHNLLVKATDMAENTSQALVQFVVK